MDIEIRRNNTIRFSINKPDKVKEWLEKMQPQLKGEAKELVEKTRKELAEFEKSVWEYLEQNTIYDLDGKRISKETHEIGYDHELIEEKEGLRIEKITKVYIIPK